MRRGFTLAEVLITLAILTIGMVTLLMAFSLALRTSRNVEEAETALNIANTKMEELRNLKYAGLENSTADASTIFSSISGYTVTVSTTKPANPAEVTVTVSWAAKGGTASVTLNTIMSDY